MIRALRNLGRMAAIGVVLARHDALTALTKPPFTDQPVLTFAARTLGCLFRRRGRDPNLRPGQRLAGALVDLGPSFIKLGQALSTRADLVGEEIATDLSRLQDRLPPFETKIARAIIERELEQPIEALFESLEDQPVAAASIAQVHFAVTTEGHHVAVKILRPGVEDHFRRDLALLLWIAERLDSLIPSLRRLKLIDVVETFGETTRLEMDLRFEAAAAAELRDNFLDDPHFHVPEVDWQRTARHVLVLERISAIPANDREALLAAGLDLEEVLARSATAFFKQVLHHGYFHADMHPGNLFIDQKGTVIPVDFGIMGRLDVRTRRYLAEMLLGFLTGDYRKVADIHFRAGYVPSHKNLESFTQACRSIGEPILGKPLNEISFGRLLGQLFEITELFEMETQPQLLLLQKTLMQAEGMSRMLHSDSNMWALAQPLVEDWMLLNLGPQARAKEIVEDVAHGLERLPSLVVKMEDSARHFSQNGMPLDQSSLDQLTKAMRNRNLLLWPLVVILAFLLGLAL